eukprot:jgi/Galph1/3413/GphlegSOOS_G2079.1
MQNLDKKIVDLYVPRKCAASNRIITARDYASVQISIAKVDAEGKFTGETTTFGLSGFIRRKGLSDNAINRICQEKKLLEDIQ